MILKQKVTVILAAIFFIIGAGLAETMPIISLLAIIAMAVCVKIGGLTKRRTNIDTVLKEHGIN